MNQIAEMLEFYNLIHFPLPSLLKTYPKMDKISKTRPNTDEFYYHESIIFYCLSLIMQNEEKFKKIQNHLRRNMVTEYWSIDGDTSLALFL